MTNIHCYDCGRGVKHPIKIMGRTVCHVCFPMRSLGSSLESKLGDAIRQLTIAEINLEGARDANPFDTQVMGELSRYYSIAKRKVEDAELDIQRWKDAKIATLQQRADQLQEYEEVVSPLYRGEDNNTVDIPPEGGIEDDELPF